MTVRRFLLALVAAAGVFSVAVLSREGETAVSKMTAAAEKLVRALDDSQKEKALFTFDDKERTNWHYVPFQEKKKPLRKGLRLGEMTQEQKETALELVKTGTSPTGFNQATTIMSLETILQDLEKNGPNVRNPEWYFFSVFGTPSKAGKWGWRVEGHHLSLNFTLDHGQITGATPFFFGANPAEVKAGLRKGLRTLPDAEDSVRDLFTALDEGQRKVARQSKLFADVVEGKALVRETTPLGLSGERMTDPQRRILQNVLEGYTNRMPAPVALAELTRVRDAGLDKVYFAFARADDKPGKPYTYHLQGPTFLIEFLNVQEDSAHNPANHIHSVWHDLPGDFGLAAR
jgi:ketosteroid isomerase-like protein